MSYPVYKTFWISRIGDVRKEHGTYASEEDALNGIKAWWELHKEDYSDHLLKRTNSGALEVIYRDDQSFYRIEKHHSPTKPAKPSYRKKREGEIDALRRKMLLDDETFLFDELAEPYRDRILLAMSDATKARQYTFDKEGRPIKELSVR